MKQCPGFLLQSNPVNTDTGGGGGIESVRMKQVEFRENARA